MPEKDNIPAIPNQVYDEWTSWGDFLGTGYVATQNRNFLEFEQARLFVRQLKITKSDEWKEYCKSGAKPENIPTHPHVIYRKLWKGWGDWFGTGSVATYKRQYKSFEEAIHYVHSKKFKNQKAWYYFCKSGERPEDIPANPQKVYKEYWRGYSHWLGVTNRILNNQQRPFEKVKELVHSLNLRSQKEWFTYCKSGNKPDDIPTGVVASYKDEWKGWGDFLGTGNNSPVRPKDARPFGAAKEYIRSLKISGCKEWLEYCRSGSKPKDIPANPQNVYKSDWRGWSDWLGKEPSGSEKRLYMAFFDAKRIVAKMGLKTVKEWQKYAKTGRPKNIPSHPNEIYKEEWNGWADWLGTK